MMTSDEQLYLEQLKTALTDLLAIGGPSARSWKRLWRQRVLRAKTLLTRTTPITPPSPSAAADRAAADTLPPEVSAYLATPEGRAAAREILLAQDAENHRIEDRTFIRGLRLGQMLRNHVRRIAERG